MEDRRYYRGIRATARIACALLTLSALFAGCPPGAFAAIAQSEVAAECDDLKRDPMPAWTDSAESSKRLADCGRAFTHDGSYERARVVFAAALEMAKRRSDRPAMARALDGSGITLIAQGNGDRAEPLLLESLKISEELGDTDGEAEASRQLGRLRNMQARYDEARTYHMRSLTLWQSLGDRTGVAVALNNVGAMDLALGDNVAAAAYYQRSLDELDRLGDWLRGATVIDNLARISRAVGDYTKGLELSRKALAIREEFNDREGIARSLTSLSENYRAQGDYTSALESLRRSLDLRSALGLVFGIAETLNNIAVVYEAQGNYTQAARYLRRSLALNDAKVHSASLSAEIHAHLGEVFFGQGRNASAVRSLERSLAISGASGFMPEAADARLALARVQLALGRLNGAAQSLEQVLGFRDVTGDRGGRADALIEMAEVDRRRGRLEQGLAAATEARELADAMELVDMRWRATTAVGRLNVALKRPDAARQAFDDAIAVVELLRSQNSGGEETRVRFFADRLAPYKERIALALARSETADAFYFAERSKARALVDVIGTERRPVTTAMTEPERERELALRISLSSANSEVLHAARTMPRDEIRVEALKRKRDGSRLDYEDFELRLYAAHPALQINRAVASVITASEAQRLLPDGSAAIVEFVAGRDRTHAFVISASGLRSFVLPASTVEIGRRVQRFRDQVAIRDLRSSDSARQLYELVLGPLRAALLGKTALIVVPDGTLWNLPFQALQSSAGRYLIEDVAISYAPSVTVLRHTMQHRADNQTPPTLFALGNPADDPEAAGRQGSKAAGAEPRRQVETEVIRLARVYGPSSRVYVGADAREDRWKAEAPNYRVVHLAAHGLLDGGSPLYSHLVLARPGPGDREDGLLEAWEIMNMQLRADLVVLSACETARGRVAPGEGVIGLMWAVFVAGTPATLVSQWQVDAASSTLLMVAFHRAWKGGAREVSKARALQLASLEVLRTPGFSHPFYWAGFILAGDPR